MSDQQNTPQQQELPLDALGQVDPVEAILQRWEDQPSDEQVASDDPEEATDTDTEETTGDDDLNDEDTQSDEDEEDTEADPDEEEEAEDEDEDEETVELSDDTLIDIVVNGETQQASVKDLKRLWGQEASLTQKSQEVARQRKEATEVTEKSSAVLQRMLERAQEQWKPYSEVDMLVASRQLSEEDFTALRREAAAAKQNLDFLTEEAEGFYRDLKAQQNRAMQQAAQECVKTLQQELPNWSNSLYNDIRAYAVSNGLPQEAVDTFTDPNVILILNKARLYDEGRKVATVKKKTPKARVLKSKKSPPNEQSRKADKVSKLAERARLTNDTDDLAELIMSRWET
jgi:hypothetical protein